jgi:hypothetical protein
MVTTLTSFVQFTANGSATRFDFPFFALDAGHVKASVNGAPVGVTVSLNGDSVGGVATLLVRPASGAVVRIFRETPVLQELDLRYNTELPSEAIERALDRRTCIEQEQRDRLNELLAQNAALLAVKQGPKGDKGDPGASAGQYWSTVFRQSATKPATPTALFGPVPPGWSDVWTSDTSQPWWQSRAKLNESNSVAVPWSEPLLVSGRDGRWKSVVFKLSEARPVTPSGTAPVPSGWLDGPDATPLEGRRWWMSSALVTDGAAGAWSVPVPATGEEGEAGAGGEWEDRVYLVSVTEPSPPAGENLGGWSDNLSVPPSGSYLWMAAAWRDGAGVLTSGWSVTRLTGEKGNPGNYVSRVFRATLGLAPATPVGTAPVPSGWVDSPNATVDELGNPLVWWMSEGQVLASTGSVPGGWSLPVQVTGRNGDNVFFIYKASVTPPTQLAANVLPDSSAFDASGWSYSPPTDVPDGAFVWMSKGVYELASATVVKGWSVPERISGESADVPVFLYKNGVVVADAPSVSGSITNLPGQDWGAALYSHFASQQWFPRTSTQLNANKQIWMSQGYFNSGGTGVTQEFSSPILITGERGSEGPPGLSFEVVFQSSLGVPPKPVGNDLGNWGYTVPLVVEPALLWMCSRSLRGDSLVVDWSLPVRLSGQQGPEGRPGIGMSTTAKGSFDIPNWWDNGMVLGFSTFKCDYNITGGVVNLRVVLMRDGTPRQGHFGGPTLFDISAIGIEHFPAEEPVNPGLSWIRKIGIPLSCYAAHASSNGLDEEPMFRLIRVSDKLYVFGTTEWDNFPGNEYYFSDHYIQNGQAVLVIGGSYNLEVNPPTQFAPSIVSQSQSQTVSSEASLTLFVTVDANPPASFVWLKDGAPIPGATSNVLTIGPADAGSSATYVCISSNGLGQAQSADIIIQREDPV